MCVRMSNHGKRERQSIMRHSHSESGREAGMEGEAGNRTGTKIVQCCQGPQYLHPMGCILLPFCNCHQEHAAGPSDPLWPAVCQENTPPGRSFHSSLACSWRSPPTPRPLGKRLWSSTCFPDGIEHDGIMGRYMLSQY